MGAKNIRALVLEKGPERFVLGGVEGVQVGLLGKTAARGVFMRMHLHL